MANETEQEILDREALELAEKNKPVELTDELIEEAIKKKFGVSSDELVKKADQVVVLSDAEKAELAEKKKEKVHTTALEKGWYKKDEYDEFLKSQSVGKIELAKKKFIEDNSDLDEKEAEKRFNTIFRIEEDDEIEEDEIIVTNEKKKTALSFTEKMADQYLKTKYAPIINAESKFDSYEQSTKVENTNKETVAKTIAALPTDIQIELSPASEGVEARTFNYKITDEDKKEVAALFLEDQHLIKRKEIKPEALSANALMYIKAKNFEKIMAEAVEVEIEKVRSSYERGEKGIIPVRANASNSALSAQQEFNKKMGLPV